MIRFFISFFALVFFSSCMIQYATGLTQIKQEKYEQATYNLSVALSKDPKNPEIYFARAFSRGSMGQPRLYAWIQPMRITIFIEATLNPNLEMTKVLSEIFQHPSYVIPTTGRRIITVASI